MRISLVVFLILLPAAGVQGMSLHPADATEDNAVEDANRAWQRGDRRLLGMMTRGLSVPGVATSRLAQARKHCGILTLSTSDIISSEGQMQSLRERARYIEAYNRFMIERCLPADDAP